MVAPYVVSAPNMKRINPMAIQALIACECVTDAAIQENTVGYRAAGRS